MDPLESYNYEICEKIFSYLTVKELLNCSLINKNYYEFIAKTSSCMKRIKIYLNASNIDHADLQSLNTLNESVRRYQHFESFNMSIELYNLLFPKKIFKTIKMKRFTFQTEDEFELFISGISESIEELKLERFLMQYEFIDYTSKYSFNFPKLKHLELKYAPNIIFKYFAHCSNLRDLRVTGKRDVHFYSMLRQSPTLKKLAIVSDEIDNYFEDDISKFIQSKLTYFEARDIYNLTTTCIANFKIFLENQMNCLEEIDLGDWIAINIVKMIFHMPMLKKLTFKGFHNIEEHVNMNEIEFRKNHSITTLHLIDVFAKAGILKSFITACPNVKHIKLYSLQKDSLIFLAREVPLLESLTIDILEIEDLNNECDFPHLKEFKMQVCHNSLNNISNESTNNFEKFVKREIINIEQRNKVKFC